MKLYAGIILVLSFVVAAVAEMSVSGDLQNIALNPSAGPFIVEQDLIVPDGKKVKIPAGCVFLFKPFTGIQVQGSLFIEGTQQKPVIFTSVNDGDYNPKSQQLPNPFDWNGILVAKESNVVALSNFSLRYSVYGIKSQNPNIQIQNGIFKQNGQFHFTINDKIQYVQDNLPYSYGETPAATPDATVKTTAATTDKPKLDNGSKGQASSHRITLRYTCLGVGAVGVIAGTVLGVMAGNSYQTWQKVSTSAPSSATETQFNNDKTQFNNQLLSSIITGSIGALGLIGFGLTYSF